ncbi:MAG: zinc-ribbon domain-containing protein, partial [Gemmataceae bacterium]|nr:zinc-ribbon domain-containing protein [Gemmataceae bacterium]
MPTLIKCPNCQREMKIPDAALGKKGRCAVCKQVFVAPSPTTQPEAPKFEVVPPPEPKPAVADELPAADPIAEDPIAEELVAEEPRPSRSRPRDDGRDDEDDRPRARDRRDDRNEDDRPRRKKGRARDERDDKPVTPKPVAQGFLRFIVFAGGLTAAAVCGFVFWLWQREANEIAAPIKLLGGLAQALDPKANIAKDLKQLEEHGQAYPFMLLAAGAGLAGGFLGLIRSGKAGGLLMLVAAGLPVIFFQPSILFTSGLIAAGVLGLMIQSRSRARTIAERAAAEGRRPGVNPFVLVCAVLGLLFFLGYGPLMALALDKAQ